MMGKFWFLSILFILPILSACAKNGRSSFVALSNVLALVVLVFLVIVIITLVYRYTRQLGWIGVLLGLIAGTAIIMSVPIEAQFIFIGSILGVGADYLASAGKNGSPTTMIESLAEFVAKATNAANKIAEPVVFANQKAQISFLVWSMLGTIALMLILGRTLQDFSIGEYIVGFPATNTVAPPPTP